MGVSGCGKTVVGEAVAAQWHARFEDADKWHTPEAVAKMAAGHPLSDADRLPWLQRLKTQIIDATPPGGRTVLACSALRKSYRDLLRADAGPDLLFIHLAGPQSLIAARMAARTGHYMPTSLLDSQFAALEPPGAEEAITVSIDPSIGEITANVLAILGQPA
ncbi:MAG: gluconokinase [Verrucomicrobiales bacterium]|nr:gluconokinase [Verrucomicrobiales bacterium]